MNLRFTVNLASNKETAVRRAQVASGTA